MKIDYIYRADNENGITEEELKRMEREETIGCLLTGLVLLVMVYLFLAMLPFLLVFLGIMIIALAGYIVYKLYLESYVLNYIQKRNMRKGKK